MYGVCIRMFTWILAVCFTRVFSVMHLACDLTVVSLSSLGGPRPMTLGKLFCAHVILGGKCNVLETLGFTDPRVRDKF